MAQGSRDFIPLNNFTAGEVTPNLFGRTDLKRYFNGAASIRNFLALPQGGLTRRPGTVFVSEVKDSTKITRLIRFEFSTVQAYILEFGDFYMRVYKTHGQVQVVGVPYEVVTPWTQAQVFQLKITQSADTLYVCHPTVQTRVITRTGDTNWTVSIFGFQDGPYLDVNTTSTTVSMTNAVGAGGNLVASSIVGINNGQGFLATDVGRVVRVNQGQWGWGTITAVTNTTNAVVTVVVAPGAGAAGTNWRLGAWSDTTGWPYCAAFAENRLCFGGTNNQPANVWGSRTGNFVSFAPSDANGTVAADHAFNVFIGDDRVNAIRWISMGRDMLIGTQGAEYILTGGPNAAISPTTAIQKRQTTYGAHPNVVPQRTSHTLLFLQRAGKKIREAQFDWQVDGYKAPDLTILANHVTGPGVVDMDYQQEPASILWCVRSDGVLAGMTYEHAQEVISWHQQTIGGNGFVESVAVIPDPTGTFNELWLLVRRTINGVKRRYIEYMTPQYDDATIGITKAFFVDSGLSYDGTQSTTLVLTATTGAGVTATAGAAVFTAGMVGQQIWGPGAPDATGVPTGKAHITAFTDATHVTITVDVPFQSVNIASGFWSIAAKTFTGLGYLEASTLSVLGDGATHPTVVVAGGSITLQRFAVRVSAGFGYTSLLKSLPLEQAGGGEINPKHKRISRSYIRFLETGAGGQFGPSGPDPDETNAATTLESIIMRRTDDRMGIACPIYTGTKEVDYPNGWETDGQVTVQQTQPLPMTILSIDHDTTISY